MNPEYSRPSQPEEPPMMFSFLPKRDIAVKAVAAVGLFLSLSNSQATAQVSPEQSAKLLKPAEGLEATLWAAEPMVVNPTTMDIDSRGRVWITEGLNYRLSRGGNRQFQRKEDADKIKILEDTDGDGKADKMTVFADKVFPVPMGLALEEKWGSDGKYKGCKIYVGNSPNILVLEDTDGDDKADKRYPLLTGFGGIDSDHGVHGMVLGLDGKLYFTHGDGCCSVQTDRSERVQNFDVHDKSGRHVSSDQLANTLRVNRDGTQFEILADRQRNNYETSLNAFGNIFTSDNDDDGNRGSRVIWLMEGGHYGYRTPGSARHWGEDTPGPIPKLVGTGNGSPCGLAVYEGSLLPAEFHGAVLEAEAGPRVVNYFPLQRHDSGFRTEHKVLLGSDDQWFRPVDVTTSPDGAVFVADWYDGGVGGHSFRDQTTGRIYRVAPKGNKKPGKVSVDLRTIAGLVDALGSANVSTRFAARERLVNLEGDDKQKAVVALELLANRMNDSLELTGPRALTVLQSMNGDGAVVPFLKSTTPQIRELAVRLLGRDVSRNGNVELKDGVVKAPLRGELNINHLAALANDHDAGVRRELILALRQVPTPIAGDTLRTLASHWDGQDRWYLEALGLALDGRESDYIANLFDGRLFGDLNLTQAGKDGTIAVPPYFPADRNEAYIKTGTPDLASNSLGKTLGLAWRLHRPEALALIGKILPSLEATELKQAADDILKQFNDKNAAIVVAELINKASDSNRKSQLLTTLARRIGNEWRDASGSPQVVGAIEAALKDPGQRVAGINAAAATKDGRYGKALMEFIADTKVDEESRVAAVEAIGAIKPAKTQEFLDSLIASAKGKGTSNALADAALRTLPNVTKVDDRLAAIIGSKDYPLGLRREAVRSYARLRDGGFKVLAMAREGKLPEDLKTEAMSIVHRDTDRRVRDEAAKVLPLPNTTSGRPVPPIFMLVRAEGNAEKGRAVFFREGANACGNCHRVQGQGNWIGPDLSTIGAKDGKAELVQSILNPSSAIGYNFRSQVVALKDGRVITGLIVEDTNDRLVLKTAEGQRVSIAPDTIEERKTSEVSLMPEGLAQTLSDQDLIDVLTFLTTLKQPVTVAGRYHVSGPASADAKYPAIVAYNYQPVTADVESKIALRALTGNDKATAAYFSINAVAPEATSAKLVVDTKANVKEVFVDGELVKLEANKSGIKTVEVKLKKGENSIIIRVPGGSEGEIVTSFVSSKALELK
jgi:putative membrane-bound dehydrogenase-like protein